MNKESQHVAATWFVGASFGGTDDQLPRFLSEGIWENGYEDKHLDVVRSMRPGDRIAVKSSYTRKHGLPFDNRGQSVSVMAIKATGTITENLNDGRHVRVEWTKVEPAREWYFYTHRGTVWRVLPGEWMTDGLIAFTFEDNPQDIDRFRNAPYWKERFGSVAPDKRRFGWTKFYEAVADKLLDFRHNRSALVKGIQEIASRVDGLGYLAEDQYANGTKGFVKDICPFTAMGIFNRGMKDSNRKIVAVELAKFLGVEEAVPESFEGIPLLNNMKSWYFPRENNRDPDHIDSLWAVFAAGIKFADVDNEDGKDEFAAAFDDANGRRGVGWNLTFGLYWARPWAFPSLDHNSQVYVTKKLSVPIGRHGPKRRCSAADYLDVMDALEPRFQEASYPVHSYPELSLEAWMYKDPTAEPAEDEGTEPGDDAESDDPGDDLGEGAAKSAVPIVPYAADDVLNDGCFLDRSEIDRLLQRLRTKKNLILQGPPGTGKTWLAKRLAFALMGQRDESKVRAVQFHPNLSYEDFVRGWRPTGDGRLSLVDGVFMEAIKAASKDSTARFVVVIEEINRGNPAQIFGELLTLLEAGKRTPNEALELCYPDPDGKRRPVHIPENLYVIGTMNIADRSLALVDLALRRRFAFVDLEPRLGSTWREFVVGERAVDPALAADVERRIRDLNDLITADARLGKQFRIGHSYVTPAYPLEVGETRQWFQDVVETEIGPLLEEYWFDAPGEAKKACERLIQGW
ncbi:McrB family protein [Thauera butanivorans]|uniref:McrB family protein n=1 Tax=Thauera butanivorans TaxID=86174 RepID=UPI0008392948|nr:AAA family ATPase [Thauera butanivorans]